MRFRKELSLFAFLLIIPLLLNSQSIQLPRRHTYLFISESDSFRKAGCDLRSAMIKAIPLNDTSILRKYNRVHLTHETVDRIYVQSPILTEGESHILLFWMGDYAQIMADLRQGVDYFAELIDERILTPNFFCGNFSKDLLPYWLEKSNEIKANINEALLTQPEKDVLIFYWDMILLAIEEKHEAFNSEIKRADNLIQAYPDCGCQAFLERMLRTKRRTVNRYIHTGIGYSPGYLTGPIRNYLNPVNSVLWSIGFTYRQRWNIQLYSFMASRLTNGVVPLQAIDGKNIEENSGFRLSFTGLLVGTRILKTRYFEMQAFGSVWSSRMSSVLDVADSTITTFRSEDFFPAGFGFDCYIPLYKQKHQRAKKLYPFVNHSFRSDGSFPTGGFGLNLIACYMPTFFNRPTGVSGGFAFYGVNLRMTIHYNYIKTSIRKWV